MGKSNPPPNMDPKGIPTFCMSAEKSQAHNIRRVVSSKEEVKKNPLDAWIYATSAPYVELCWWRQYMSIHKPGGGIFPASNVVDYATLRQEGWCRVSYCRLGYSIVW